MATQAQLASDLRDVQVQQEKIIGEVRATQAASDLLKTRVTELEAIVAAGGDASQELTDAVAAVKAQAQILDDAIPDVT